MSKISQIPAVVEKKHINFSGLLFAAPASRELGLGAMDGKSGGTKTMN